MKGLVGVVVVLVALYVGGAFVWKAPAPTERMKNSPQWGDGAFVNPNGVALSLVSWETLATMQEYLFTRRADIRPADPVPTIPINPADWIDPAPDRFDYAWLGHSSILVALAGKVTLFDPVFEKRASPVDWYGPDRFFPAPMDASTLPHLDAVVITHDHYDHLEEPTIRRLASKTDRFVVPLGVGALIAAWGVPAGKIVELDWGESTALDGVVFNATPAIHYASRGLYDANQRLWCSWVVTGGGHRFFVSGDSGYDPLFADVGAAFGPFDIAFLKVGAYNDEGTWRKVHMTPEEAIRQGIDLRAATVVPLHWVTFDMAFHTWMAPIERASEAAYANEVSLTTPRPGRKVAEGQSDIDLYWWRRLE